MSAASTLSRALLLLPALSGPALASGPILTFTGSTANDRLGTTLARAGDVTGDGVSEILVGSSLRTTANNSDGSVAVFDGASGLKLWETNGNGYQAQMGTSAVELGDVSGDGIPDVAVGAPGQYNPSNAPTGMVAAVSGAWIRNQSGLQFVWKQYGLVAQDLFGTSVANCGDLDGDGRPELAVGAPGVDITGKSNVGRVYVLSGATGAVLYSYDGQAAFQNAGDQLGLSLCTVNDLSGDARKDLVVGIPYDDSNNADAGAAHVVALGAGSATYLGAVYGTGAGDHFGWVASGSTDLDGDGKGDFAVSAPLNDFSFTDAGRVYVYSGATRALLFAVAGEQAGCQSGSALSFDGDLNWDGYPDLAIGARLHDVVGPQRGRVTLVSGHERLVMQRIDGTNNYDQLGYAVKILGGIDADPGAELGVGVPYFDVTGANDAGRVQIWGGADFSAYSFCTAATNSTGSAALISSTGSLSTAAGSFTLVTSGCPANKTARYFYGPTATGPVLFGNGWRCIGSPFYRLPLLTTSATGVGSFTLDFNALPPSGPIFPGTSENFQLWYRDPSAGGANFNSSNALNVTFRP